jgi:hypothetical protein
MKRRALQIVVLLLLGAIVNVAVAWGCAAFLVVDGSTCKSVMIGFVHAQPPQWYATMYSRSGAVRLYGFAPNEEQGEFLSDDKRVFPVPHWSRLRTRPLSTNDRCVDDVRGWPMVSLRSGFDALADPNNSAGIIARSVGGVPLPPQPRVMATTVWDVRALPLIPIWPAFAINTIFYAAILWVLFFAPGKVRRSIRRRRGLCPACAYPIGTSEICTECGAQLRTPTAESRQQIAESPQ